MGRVERRRAMEEEEETNTKSLNNGAHHAGSQVAHADSGHCFAFSREV
jgi:hypothetical protein